MSGGHYNYIYGRLLDEVGGEMQDIEMNDLIKDLGEVLHDLEWWQSADYSEEKYRETLSKFKAKWLRGNETDRLKGYIDQQINITRQQLYEMLGAKKILGKPKKTINIFDGATNGDVIRAMYPDIQIDYHEKTDLIDRNVTVFIKDCDTCQDYSYDWWNAQYTREADNE